MEKTWGEVERKIRSKGEGGAETFRKSGEGWEGGGGVGVGEEKEEEQMEERSG